MISARQRRTFVAVSFGPSDSRPETVSEITCVHYKDDEQVGRALCCNFLPLAKGRKGTSGLLPFDKVFNSLRPLLTNLDLPVIVWDDDARIMLDTLIRENDIPNITHSPRYFILRKYAVRRIGQKAESWSFSKIAKDLSLQVGRVSNPSAEILAMLMLRIEDKYSTPPGVAKAFCAFCASIMEDGVIEFKEAIELRSLIELLVIRYPEFLNLKKELDKVLEDSIVTDEESRHLMRILEEMVSYYKKFFVCEKEV